MTFKEELKNISDEIAVNRVIKECCAIMKDRMKRCAKEGYRTYQIEVLKPTPKYDESYDIPENYQIISIHKNHIINDYVSSICAHLITDLGFAVNDIEKSNLQNSRYVSTQITIRW
jgi:hypothetical protein